MGNTNTHTLLSKLKWSLGYGVLSNIIKNDGDLAMFDWVSSALRTRGSGIPGQAAGGTWEQPGRQRTGHIRQNSNSNYRISWLFQSLGQKLLAFLFNLHSIYLVILYV